jgi:hypothetical protein
MGITGQELHPVFSGAIITRQKSNRPHDFILKLCKVKYFVTMVTVTVVRFASSRYETARLRLSDSAARVKCDPAVNRGLCNVIYFGLAAYIRLISKQSYLLPDEL